MNDERRTPQDFFQKVNESFRFTVDAAASAGNALCSHYWDKETDGLAQNWSGEIVWCNPPYSRGQLIRWVKTAAFSSNCTTLMLLPADNSTKAGQLALDWARAVLFINYRLAFDNEKSSAKFASWLVLFGGTQEDVINLEDLNLGVVLRPARLRELYGFFG